MEVDSEDDIPLAKVAKRMSVDDAIVITVESNTDGNEPKNNCTSEMISEYQWPQNRLGEYFLLQEHLVDLLQIKLSDERLLDLEKRCVSSEEQDFLLEQGLITRIQTVLGVNAVKTEDACQFMAEHFPQKFKSYIKYVHHKEMKKLICKQEAQRVDVITGKIPNFMKRALKETVRYNSKLNAERKEERCAYFDLQTQIIHLPQKKTKYDPYNISKHSQYPVVLMPGQYQEYFKRYTSDELKRFPLNTVTASFSHLQKTTDAVLPADIDKDKTDEIEKNDKLDNTSETNIENSSEKDPFCGICMKGPEMNKQGLPEKLIHCSQCENSGHPSCLDMNRHIVKVIQTYQWQCMECKICTECLAPHDEDEMMFCDNCDRGYHSYCVGLKEIPKGRWVCVRCGKCSSCLCLNSVSDGGTIRWKNEYSKPNDESGPDFLQIHCHSCSKLFRKGSFCPVCLKVYRSDEDSINPMVCCDSCDRWIHTDCDGIDERRYLELSKDRKSSYTCILCRGEKEERMDAYHRKNR